MKKNNIIKTVAFSVIICLFASCGNKNEFTIKGDVAGASGKTMYFENIGTNKITLLDSVKLNDKGSFKFSKLRPDAPDFYRLRLDGQLINLSIDSTETVTIHADGSNFAKGYTVEGSTESEKLKELTLLQLNTSISYNKLQKAFDAKEISTNEYAEKATAVIKDYKSNALKYIYSNPRSASAYFALFQQVNNLLIFNPYDKEDYKALGAVATSWSQFYPEASRSKHLYNLATNALATIRGERPIQYDYIETDTKSIFDISLPSISGKEIRLSEACKGQITLIDFTAYGLEQSPAHNMLLAEIYEKYKNKGFQIYQISLDSDEHYWKNAAVNIPWISVRDPQSVYSEIAKKYNVTEIPTAYIMDREGDIVKRLDSFESLEKEISSYLK